MSVNRTQWLNAKLAELGRSDCSIEYRPFDGWWMTGEPRYPGDDGAWIGFSWEQAAAELDFLLSYLFPRPAPEEDV